MSLINQMLQDLEKRRASGAERGALPDQVRVLPREETHSMPKWLIGVAAAVALIVLIAWQFNRQPPPATLPPVAQMPSPASSALQGPASRLALDLQQVPAPRARRNGGAIDLAALAKTTSRGTGPQPVMTAAVSLPVVAAVATEPPQAAIPARMEPAKPLTTLADIAKPASAALTSATAPTIGARPVPVTAPDPKVQTAAANPQIDKRAQTLSPQQLAENEYREAANAMNQGRLSEAQEGFRRALQNNPAHVGARQGLFGLLIEAKKTAEAEQLLQEGLVLNSNQLGFAMALSSLQYERGDIGGAIDTMQKSAPAAQSSPDYLARLAGLLQRQSRHREAIDNYQAALRLAPGSGVWLMGLGISLQASNRNSEAQEAFRRAKSSNSLNPDLQAFVDQRLKQLQ